jgi:hypothetical protein
MYATLALRLTEATKIALVSGKKLPILSMLLLGAHWESAYNTTSQEGQKRSKVEVVAQDVTFLGGRGEGGGDSSNYESAPAAKPQKKQDVVIEDISDEPIDLSEIPF